MVKEKPFNSTRYIRNLKSKRNVVEYLRLSTPHGTLGTKDTPTNQHKNPTLSTPHGTLGTYLTHSDVNYKVSLSTPHGTLGTCSSPY